MIESIISLYTWNDWLNIYLLIGVVVIFGILFQVFRNEPSSFSKKMMRALGYEKKIKELAQDWLIYTLASVTVIIVWPGFIGWLIYEKIQSAKNRKWENKPNFKAAPQYLTKITSIEAAESENFVTDPLGFTPKVPFGHLNKAWLMFLENKLPEDELWYFDIPKGNPVGKYERLSEGHISGIAILHKGAICDEFLIESD